MALYQNFLTILNEECPSVITAWRDLLPLARPVIESQAHQYLTPDGVLKQRRAVTGPSVDAAVTAYLAAMNTWETDHFLVTKNNWLITLAHNRFADHVNLGRPLELHGAISTGLHYTPAAPDLTLPPYLGHESPGKYKTLALELAKQLIDAHVRERAAELEADPLIERVPFMQEQGRKALRDAVRWQALEEPPRKTSSTVRKLLGRLQIVPRPGLRG